MMIHTADPIVISLISSGYLMIAYQAYKGTDWKKVNPKTKRAMASFIFIFILCAICGYTSTLIEVDTYFGWFVRNSLHWFLAGATWSFVATSQAKIISKDLEH